MPAFFSFLARQRSLANSVLPERLLPIPVESPASPITQTAAPSPTATTSAATSASAAAAATTNAGYSPGMDVPGAGTALGATAMPTMQGLLATSGTLPDCPAAAAAAGAGASASACGMPLAAGPETAGSLSAVIATAAAPGPAAIPVSVRRLTPPSISTPIPLRPPSAAAPTHPTPMPLRTQPLPVQLPHPPAAHPSPPRTAAPSAEVAASSMRDSTSQGRSSVPTTTTTRPLAALLLHPLDGPSLESPPPEPLRQTHSRRSRGSHHAAPDASADPPVNTSDGPRKDVRPAAERVPPRHRPSRGGDARPRSASHGTAGVAPAGSAASAAVAAAVNPLAARASVPLPPSEGNDSAELTNVSAGSEAAEPEAPTQAPAHQGLPTWASEPTLYCLPPRPPVDAASVGAVTPGPPAIIDAATAAVAVCAPSALPVVVSPPKGAPLPMRVVPSVLPTIAAKGAAAAAAATGPSSTAGRLPADRTAFARSASLSNLPGEGSNSTTVRASSNSVRRTRARTRGCGVRPHGLHAAVSAATIAEGDHDATGVYLDDTFLGSVAERVAAVPGDRPPTAGRGPVGSGSIDAQSMSRHSSTTTLSSCALSDAVANPTNIPATTAANTTTTNATANTAASNVPTSALSLSGSPRDGDARRAPVTPPSPRTTAATCTLSTFTSGPSSADLLNPPLPVHRSDPAFNAPLQVMAATPGSPAAAETGIQSARPAVGHLVLTAGASSPPAPPLPPTQLSPSDSYLGTVSTATTAIAVVAGPLATAAASAAAFASAAAAAHAAARNGLGAAAPFMVSALTPPLSPAAAAASEGDTATDGGSPRAALSHSGSPTGSPPISVTTCFNAPPIAVSSPVLITATTTPTTASTLSAAATAAAPASGAPGVRPATAPRSPLASMLPPSPTGAPAHLLAAGSVGRLAPYGPSAAFAVAATGAPAGVSGAGEVSPTFANLVAMVAGASGASPGDEAVDTAPVGGSAPLPPPPVPHPSEGVRAATAASADAINARVAAAFAGLGAPTQV